MEKKDLRKAMKRRNLVLCPEARAEASARIFAQVEAMPAFAAARTVALFVSLDDEPDTREALERWRATRRVVVPRVEGETMRFFRYDPATMRPGAFGIPEPGPEAESCDPAAIDLVAVHGTAFTASGARCGRGRGYYDRYLAQPGMRAVRIGICYRHQVVEVLPVEAHDVRMDAVVWG